MRGALEGKNCLPEPINQGHCCTVMRTLSYPIASFLPPPHPSAFAAHTLWRTRALPSCYAPLIPLCSLTNPRLLCPLLNLSLKHLLQLLAGALDGVTWQVGVELLVENFPPLPPPPAL